MALTDLKSVAEDKAWKVFGGFLATAAVASGTILGAALLSQIGSLHDDIAKLGAETAKAVAQLSDLSDSHKELRTDINRSLSQQRDDEIKQAELSAAISANAAGLARVEDEIKALTRKP